jgi:hypothetical protein
MCHRSSVIFTFLIALGLATALADGRNGCVFKVTGPAGHTLYLGGSEHGLLSTDYPLPPAYSRAFDLSERLAFEDSPEMNKREAAQLLKGMEYPKGDSLKNHIDPRTYDYLKRVFTRMGAKDESYARLRPWGIIMLLWTPEFSGLSTDLGIEGFLRKRAKANHKAIDGLETFREHFEILSGLTDRQAEAVILITFIPHSKSEGDPRLLDAWRRGDIDTLARVTQAGYADFPGFGRRLLDDRNRNWIPKIGRYLMSGHTYFVVVGSAHLGGPNGVVALLRQRGYQVDQL